MVSKEMFIQQAENCSIFAKNKLVIGFGIKDLIIVEDGDVILVMPKNKDQEMKYLVNKLKEEKIYDKYL